LGLTVAVGGGAICIYGESKWGPGPFYILQLTAAHNC